MKIAVIGSASASLVNFRGPMIERMVRTGAEVVGMAPGPAPAVAAALEEIGAQYHPFSLDRAGTNPFNDLLSVQELQRHFETLRPDLVVAYTMKPVIYGLYAARRAGVARRAAMITGLGYAFGEGEGLKQRATGYVVRRLSRTALRGAEAVFFQNPEDRQFFETSGLLDPVSKVIRLNGTGVDLGHFEAAPVPEGPPRFLLVARLLQDKGIPEYLEAASRIKREHPEVQFDLIGETDENPGSIRPEELVPLVDDGVLEYHGQVDDVRPALRAASVFVLPTAYREGVPRSIQEALAIGRAVITSDRPGCRETVLPGENGFLVPARDTEALVSAMAQFVEQPSLAGQMGRASRRLAERRYDVDNINTVILSSLSLGIS